MADRFYLCIDLKSFYASVECVERGLDPMSENLVVADPDRNYGTICLAITPAMKALGIKNRCRVYEIPKEVEYITAPPRMKLYIEYSAEIYAVYLEYIAKEDIHVYSIDEAFLDVTEYLKMYGMTAGELGHKIMSTIFERTGIRATCGIGTNLYLAKVALDITAKKAPDYMGFLNEELYRQTLWQHKPLTDFWRIGVGTAKKLSYYGIKTMESIAQASEDFLYRLFGVDAELLIDHAWGREPVTIADIKNYKPKSNCLSSGQTLLRDYAFDEGRIIVKEMTDLLCLDLTDKNLITNSITLHIGYTRGAEKPPAHGSVKLEPETNSDSIMISAVEKLYEKIVDRAVPIRHINITCNNVAAEECRQYSFFDEVNNIDRSRKIQKAVLEVKKRYGKNSILRGINLLEAGTTIERNRQIGGHKSGE